VQRFDVGRKLRCDLAHTGYTNRFANRCGMRQAA
jgi:hypothetical protein